MIDISLNTLKNQFKNSENFINFTNTKKEDIKRIAIGNFDGFHLGHQKLFEKLDNQSAIIIIVTQKELLAPPRFYEKFSSFPIFYCDLEMIKNLTAEEFLEILYLNFANLDSIVVGSDFRFGSKRLWDTLYLKHHFKGNTIVVDEFRINNVGVHSTKIKEFLNNGFCEEVHKFLGRYFEIQGDIVSGQGIGAKKLVATLNLSIEGFFIPKHGVYATLSEISGVTYKSITFIGHRVSTDGNFAIETHILDNFNQTKCKNMSIRFVKFLRENLEFQSLNELKSQILTDINNAKIALKGKK